MDTGLLREFIVFAECLNFTAAAKNLHMSQPTLSRHLSELEETFGADLVTRGQQVDLTYAGKTLLAEAPSLLAHEEKVRNHVIEASKLQVLGLRLEHYPYMHSITTNVRSALSLMQSLHPNVRYNVEFVQPRSHQTIPECVETGVLDIALLARTTLGPAEVHETRGICSQPLEKLRTRICFFMGADNPLARNETMSFAQLDGQEILMALNLEFQNWQDDAHALFRTFGITPLEIAVRIEDMNEFAYSNMRQRIHIITEDDIAAPNSPYLGNPNGKVVRCAEEIWAMPYLLYKADSQNPAVEHFLDALDQVLG